MLVLSLRFIIGIFRLATRAESVLLDIDQGDHCVYSFSLDSDARVLPVAGILISLRDLGDECALNRWQLCLD